MKRKRWPTDHTFDETDNSLTIAGHQLLSGNVRRCPSAAERVKKPRDDVECATWFSGYLENHVISGKLRQSEKVRQFQENAYNTFGESCATLQTVENER